MFGIGAQEMVFLAIVALLVFGPKRLPELARTMGRGLAEFRRASADLRGAFSLDPDSPAPRKNPAPGAAEVDPLTDRALVTDPPQTIGDTDIAENALRAARAAASESALQAELTDEANDEVHRAEPSPAPEDDAPDRDDTERSS